VGRSLLVALVVVAVAGCAGSPASPSQTGTTEPPDASPAPTPAATLTRSGCPVPDDAFCATATRIGRAILDRAADDLLRLSRSTTIHCAEVAREYFPGCAEEEVLTGYGISGAAFTVEVVPRPEYAERLAAVVSGIDPSSSDELGTGAPRVLGVGTCGPDIPGRRTYHVAWTAVVSDGEGDAERQLGSFEVTLEDRRWRIALWYQDGLGDWEREQPDPMTTAFCEAGLHPWAA
jgi:hypothetical protein